MGDSDGESFGMRADFTVPALEQPLALGRRAVLAKL